MAECIRGTYVDRACGEQLHGLVDLLVRDVTDVGSLADDLFRRSWDGVV